MKRIGKGAALALLGAISLYGTAASAQDASKWYAGAAVGQAKFHDLCQGVPVSCKDSDTAWKFFGGYKFHPNFSAELAYNDFGKGNANGTISGVSVNADAKSNAWELDGVGTWPLGNKFSVFGKLGLYRAKVELTGSAAVAGFSGSSSANSTNTGLTFGAGGMYDITPAIAARLELQRYSRVGSDDVGGKSDVDVISIGALFKF